MSFEAFDNFEIHPCHYLDDDDEGSLEQCDDSDAEVWVLYGHIPGQGLDAICEFDSLAHAKEIYHRIVGQPFTGNVSDDMKNVLAMRAPPKSEYKYGNAAGLEAKLLPGEPWFALRAKDRFSVLAIEEYARICEAYNLTAHAAGVRQAIEQMEEWREANPDKIKIPD